MDFILCFIFFVLYYIPASLCIVFNLVVGRLTNIGTDRAAFLAKIEHDFHRIFSHVEPLSQLKPPFIHTAILTWHDAPGQNKCTIS